MAYQGGEVCLSPLVILRPTADALICENLLAHEDFVLKIPFGKLKALTKFRSPVPVSVAPKLISEELSIPYEQAELIFDVFIESGLLIDQKRAEELSDTRQKWWDYGWESAWYLHYATKDYPFLDYSQVGAKNTDRAIMHSYIERDPIPSLYKDYPAHSFISLPPYNPDLLEEHTINVLGLEQPKSLATLDAAALSTLLYFCAGKIGDKMWPGQGAFLRKTSPSGGARHPTELYAAVLDVPQLSEGLYHYNVRKHGLDMIRSVPQLELFKMLEFAAPDMISRMNFRPAVVFFLTSIFERSMWRYRDSRSYRVICIDIGHILLTFRCVAQLLEMQWFVGQGVDHSRAESMLDLDSEQEGTMFLCAIRGR